MNLKGVSTRALHSELFSKIRVEFRVGTSFSQVEMRRVEHHFFVIFDRYFFVFSKTRKNENPEKKAILAIFSRKICEKFAKIAKIAKIHDFHEFCEFGNVRKARKLPKYFRNSKNGNFRNSRKRKFRKKTSNAGPLFPHFVWRWPIATSFATSWFKTEKIILVILSHLPWESSSLSRVGAWGLKQPPSFSVLFFLL